MLAKLVRRLLIGGEHQNSKHKFDVQSAIAEASTLFNSGDQHRAIEKYREILTHDPSNLIALNDLSSCLSSIGDNDEAQRLFELALALDDTFLPVLANRAKLLLDQRKSKEAFELLKRAKLTDPSYSAIDGVYQGLLFQHGRTDQATSMMRRTWLTNFDNLRWANAFLFTSSYRDIDERLIAQEHRFWADTLAPARAPSVKPAVPHPLSMGAKPNRIRLGYLSPDFRDHSVRFFFRPLIENHDTNRFEVFLYHDAHVRDEQTAQIQKKAEHFHEVARLTDDALTDLLHSHHLDILVDLAGHTSYNRMPIFQRRLARIHINAIGYPPTTGLATMDYKLIDRHVWTPDHQHYYSEQPMVLPGSFWCYDPMTEVPEPVAPPCTEGKNLVFGCVGNVSKITDRVLACWLEILKRLPSSRLLVRSVSFQDPDVMATLHDRLERAGLKMDRVDLRKPEGGAAYFASYNDIDIVLDTFPFNGGTTTSFAVYMGVPVITWAGNSLISRMGLSIMNNLGMPECVAHDAESYVEAAVKLASDQAALVAFRKNARQRLRASPLGNGQLFAQEFEDACEKALRNHQQKPTVATDVAVLPASELVQRAYAVLIRNQPDAARRIQMYASQHYPALANVAMLEAQVQIDAGNTAIAISNLQAKLHNFTSKEQAAVRLFLAHHYVANGSRAEAQQVLLPGIEEELEDAFDQTQLRLFRGLFTPSPPSGATDIPTTFQKVLVLCVSKGKQPIQPAIDSIRSLELPDNAKLEVQVVQFDNRLDVYMAATQRDDVNFVVIIHENLRMTNPTALIEIAKGLEHADVISYAGASRWDRFNWRGNQFDEKTATYMVREGVGTSALSLRWVGNGFDALQMNQAILEGSLLAFKAPSLREVGLEPDFLSGGVLMEEDWVHTAYALGRQLAVTRTLGIVVDVHDSLQQSDVTEALLHLIAKWSKTVFAATPDDLLYATLTVNNTDEGVALCQRLSSW